MLRVDFIVLSNYCLPSTRFKPHGILTFQTLYGTQRLKQRKEIARAQKDNVISSTDLGAYRNRFDDNLDSADHHGPQLVSQIRACNLQNRQILELCCFEIHGN